MGTVSRSHLGQLKSFRISVIYMRRAAQAFQQHMQAGDVHEPLAWWAGKRHNKQELEQVFQDDMLELAVASRAKTNAS